MKDFFGAEGPLSRQVPGYAPREAQAHMAEAVGQALEAGDTLVVEAGTGTGKTFAYLVPALLAGSRVVISTGTLTLQDQLFYRDLPRVRAALRSGARVCLLKGRANYLCWHRFARAQQQPAARGEAALLSRLREWAERTDSGEIQEFGALPEDHALVPRVTSTADNCLGGKCQDFERCFVVRARRNAQAADVTVINHHLLFADFALKDEGFGRILPGADAVIVDEAHQVPEIATRFFGVRLSTRELQELARDCAGEAANLGDVPQLRDAAADVASETAAVEPALSAVPGRERLEAFLERTGAEAVLERLSAALGALGTQLRPLAERSPELAACAARAADLAQRLGAVSGAEPGSRVAWVEGTRQGGSLHLTPIRVDEEFQRLREQHAGAWILTSATLAAAEDFSHFCGQLGLEEATTLRLASPFDYAQQARLYLPRGLPDPNDPGYPGAVAEAALPVLEASGGGAFVLCTSHRALREIAARLRAAWPRPVLVQGEASRSELLESFARDGNALLVGTASFWEGVDVRGSALRVVIIDRLPFAAPGDPVFEARLNAIREAGGDPFHAYQLPSAIMSLRQGVGRLIRDPSDRGLLMLCDPRLRSRGYGRRILASLPPMPVVETLEAATGWLHALQARTAAAGAA